MELHYTKLVEQLILKFTLVLQRFWTKCSRNHIRFIQVNSEWLKCELKLPTQEQNKTIRRPVKDFENSCERSKQNKIKTIINTFSSSEMIQATQTSLYSSENRIAANLLKESIKTPTRASKIKKAYDHSLNVIILYTNDEALDFFLDNDLTKQQYINIRLSAKKKNVNIYPTYEQILEAKRKCYPKNLQVKETSCEINIQDLLDHTIVRIFTIPYLPKIENRMHNFEIIYT